MKLRSALTAGLWPETRGHADHPELSDRARRQAEAALEELGRIGTEVRLEGGRVRFSGKMPQVAVNLIERFGDQIEALLLQERPS